jgi:hypothetical protein
MLAWSVFPLLLLLTQGGLISHSIGWSSVTIVLALAGAVFSMVNPERGIPDYLAGTHLVPRWVKQEQPVRTQD